MDNAAWLEKYRQDPLAFLDEILFHLEHRDSYFGDELVQFMEINIDEREFVDEDCVEWLQQKRYLATDRQCPVGQWRLEGLVKAAQAHHSGYTCLNQTALYLADHFDELPPTMLTVHHSRNPITAGLLYIVGRLIADQPGREQLRSKLQQIFLESFWADDPTLFYWLFVHGKFASSRSKRETVLQKISKRIRRLNRTGPNRFTEQLKEMLTYHFGCPWQLTRCTSDQYMEWAKRADRWLKAQNTTQPWA